MGVLEHLKQEWGVISRAPFAAILCAALGAGGGWWFSSRIYEGQIHSANADRDLWKDRAAKPPSSAPILGSPAPAATPKPPKVAAPAQADGHALEEQERRKLDWEARSSPISTKAETPPQPPAVAAQAPSQPTCPPGTGICLRNSNHVITDHVSCYGMTHCIDASNVTDGQYSNTVSVPPSQ